MAAVLLLIGTTILAVAGGLLGFDSRDGADWSGSRPHPYSSHNR